jgi:hypothetical protein
MLGEASMKVKVLAAVLVMTTISAAMAQTNPQKTQVPKAAVTRTTVTAAPARVYQASCVTPYIGGWQEGYPGTAKCR